MHIRSKETTKFHIFLFFIKKKLENNFPGKGTVKNPRLVGLSAVDSPENRIPLEFPPVPDPG